MPKLGILLSEVLPAVRQRAGTFNSSRDLFQPITLMIQHGFSDTGGVQKLMRDADEQILRLVLASLLVGVERAFELPA